jgi:hypothetical protein
MNTKSTLFMIMAYTCTHVTASQPNLTEFQQKLEKKNKSIQISSTDTITTAMYDQIETLKKIQQNVDDFAFACDELATYHEQIYTLQDQIETLKKIQQNVDDFAFACDELATYHEQIYTLQDQIQTWLKNNQTTLNTFRGDIVTIDYEERKTLANASQEFIDALNKNSADQETLHKNAIQELATKHEKLQALYNTFINTYQTTLEQILPITQSVVAQDRARRTTNFDNALANKTETEALH